MLEILRILFAVAIIVGVPILAKRRWRLSAAIVLSVYQIYVPGAELLGVPVPLALIAGLLLWPEFLRALGLLGVWKPTAILLGILAMYVLSLFWSVDPRWGLSFIVHWLIFLLIFSAVVAEGRRDPEFILSLLSWSIWLASGQAVSVVLFQLLPSLKLEFLASSVGTWFISSKVLADLFTVARNNVLDPAKSGGILFVNANIAAAYSGLMAFTALGIGMTVRKRSFISLASILFVSVFFTGSKAGILIALILSGLVLLLFAWRNPRWRNCLVWGFSMVLLIGTIFILGGIATGTLDANGLTGGNEFARSSVETFQIRKKIWGYALQNFHRKALLGEGFGGWQRGFAAYATREGLWSASFPPHNTLIYLWSQGGLLAGLLGIGFICRIFRISWSRLRGRGGQPWGLALAMSMGFLWTFVHGMGENFGLLGEVHMAPILATLLALTYIYQKTGNPEGSEVSLND